MIEEPPPPAPEPEETPPPPTPEPATPHRSRHAPHPETPPEPDETPAQENPETPPAEVPALEPRQSTAQETELRRQYLNLEQDIRQRLARLNGAHLSANDQKTLEDARTFFAQATQAMASGDLPRALNLARKAGLLPCRLDRVETLGLAALADMIALRKRRADGRQGRSGHYGSIDGDR